MSQELLLPLSAPAGLATLAREPVRIGHRLHNDPLFSKDELAALIGRYPRKHYSLIAMGERDRERFWREGDIGGLSGTEVMEAVARGRMWLNLRSVSEVDPRYGALLDRIFGEMAARIPGFEGPKRECGILISSPSAQVYYHADLPGQCLWQIAGRKRIYIYPSAPPFITPRLLENIALFDVEVDIPYSPAYDESARVFDLEPGQALHWPLNAPHRVENLDSVNISMTVSYTTRDIHRAQLVHLANAILRHRFRYAPRSRAISGPSYWAKAVLQKLLRGGTWVRSQRGARRPIDFRLDGARLGEIADLKAAA
jgi:hypothetical protein